MLILEWNINQATNYSENNIIPMFVINEVLSKKPDIFILTEYAITKNYAEIIKQIKNNGYGFEVTNNYACKPKQNEILIAWKENIFTADENRIEKPTAIGTMPEILMVPLKWRKIEIIVIGLRVKLFNNNYDKRKQQFVTSMELVRKKFKDSKYLIMGGDFNNNRSDYAGRSWQNEWSLGVIDEIAKANLFNRKTPNSSEGSSIYRKNQPILFQEDHYLVSEGIKTDDIHYCREFTKRNPDVYLYGEDFQVYNSKLRGVTWAIPYGSGVPEHAMLLADFDILEK